MDVEAEVFKEGEKILGKVSFKLDKEDKCMEFLCRRTSPCDWEVIEQTFDGKTVNPQDYETLSNIRLPSLTGALEEKYQAIYALEQDNK